MKVWHRFWLRWHVWHGEIEEAQRHWKALGCPRPKNPARKTTYESSRETPPRGEKADPPTGPDFPKS